MNIDNATAAQALMRHRRRVKPADKRYPFECPHCGAVLHQSHSEIYGECVLCRGNIKEKEAR